MEIKELAGKIADATNLPDRAAKGNYYMFNISHPVIVDLKNRYCAKNNIRANIPMSEQERNVFELELLNGGTLKEIAKFCEQDEARRVADK